MVFSVWLFASLPPRQVPFLLIVWAALFVPYYGTGVPFVAKGACSRTDCHQKLCSQGRMEAVWAVFKEGCGEPSASFCTTKHNGTLNLTETGAAGGVKAAWPWSR